MSREAAYIQASTTDEFMRALAEEYPITTRRFFDAGRASLTEEIESLKEQIAMRDERIQRLKDHVGDEGMGEFK